MLLDVMFDGAHQVWRAMEDAAPQLLLGQIPEETIDHVQPRGTGGHEVHREPRLSGQPRFHLGMFVCRIVVGDQMNLLAMGRAAIDLPQETQPLPFYWW